MITHYDLFAGIGGFSLALEEVFDDPVRHIFCEWESFPTSVLRRHWPDGEFYGDIADLVAYTKHPGLEGGSDQGPGHAGLPSGKRPDQTQDWTIVTGGFPCQPFSAAGRRRGTADDRYQWPNMFEVIRNVKPEWVIAENVRGLVTWNEGMVLETVCADLESEGYEVQPFIIPAVAVGAPHRRDRVWIIGRRNTADSESQRDGGSASQERRVQRQELEQTEPAGREVRSEGQRRSRDAQSFTSSDSNPDIEPSQRWSRSTGIHETDARTTGTNEGSRERGAGEARVRSQYESHGDGSRVYPDWSRNWQEVAFETCDDTVDDGLSRLVDGVPQSYSKWRQNSLKAYGNGIVPEVAMNIMAAIKASM